MIPSRHARMTICSIVVHDTWRWCSFDTDEKGKWKITVCDKTSQQKMHADIFASMYRHEIKCRANGVGKFENLF